LEELSSDVILRAVGGRCEGDFRHNLLHRHPPIAVLIKRVKPEFPYVLPLVTRYQNRDKSVQDKERCQKDKQHVEEAKHNVVVSHGAMVNLVGRVNSNKSSYRPVL